MFLLRLESSFAPSDLFERLVESCARLIISEGETRIAAWTFLAPLIQGTKVGTGGFEETVVLLTETALYVASFDFALDKVSSFTRIRLSDITQICHGMYLASLCSC